MAYTMFPAQDGLEVIPQQTVDWYADDRLKRLLKRFPLNSAVDRATYAAFKARAWTNEEESAFSERLCFATTMSHVRLLHRAVAEDWDHGIIFEDDAVVVPEFAQRLQEVLCDLPDDWDLLMLNGASSSPLMHTCLHRPCTQTAQSPCRPEMPSSRERMLVPPDGRSA